MKEELWSTPFSAKKVWLKDYFGNSNMATARRDWSLLTTKIKMIFVDFVISSFQCHKVSSTLLRLSKISRQITVNGFFLRFIQRSNRLQP